MAESMFDPKEVADAFVDADGFARWRSGLRLMPGDLTAGGVLHDTRSKFNPSTIIWADGSAGCGCHQVSFWEPLNNPPKPAQHRGQGREWTKQEFELLQAVEFMILKAIDRHRGQGREWTKQEFELLQAVEFMILKAIDREKAREQAAAAVDRLSDCCAEDVLAVRVRPELPRRRGFWASLFGGV